MHEPINACAMAPKRSLLQRMLRKLFPSQHLMPLDELPDWAHRSREEGV